jgi:hypothetical protein
MTKIIKEFSIGPNWEDKEWMIRICSELRFKRKQNKDTLLDMEILEVLERGLKERRVKEKEGEYWDTLWDCIDKTK